MPNLTEEEIEREVRTLKNLRRRSSSSPGPGALPVDPDLPPREAFEHPPEPQQYSSNDDVALGGSGPGLFWVPAHLHPELAPGEFRQFLKSHTAVNPADVGETGEATLVQRSPSWLARNNSRSGSLSRKKSMLSRQYNPKPGDKVEEEAPPLPTRSNSIYRGRNAENSVTLEDLQKLEELVDSAEMSEDPESMRKILRRSLSISMGQGMTGEETPLGELPPPEPQAAPARTGSGSIVRRAARTKYRKGSVSARRQGRVGSPSSGDYDTFSTESHGDRRSDERRSDETGSDERSSESPHPSRSSESGEASSATSVMAPPKTPSKSLPTSPVESTGTDDDTMIYDAYARERDSSSSSLDDLGPTSPGADATERKAPAVPQIVTPKLGDGTWFEDDQLTPTQDSPMSAALHAMTLLPSSGSSSQDIFSRPQQQQPQPQVQEQQRSQWQQQQMSPRRPAESSIPQPPPAAEKPVYGTPYSQLPGTALPSRVSPPPAINVPPRTGPVITTPLPVERPPLGRTETQTSASSVASSTTATTTTTKEKKKHGLFSKKHHKDKDKDHVKEKKKEKESFLGGLFGSKKKHEEPSSVSNFSTAGPAAAAALLGTSKSAKSLQPSRTSSPTSPGFSNFARYPIHVERAVYRLSHIKLANARRPLIEQVLISNLMFWYLGVIGRTAGPAENKKPGSVNGIDRERDEQLRQPAPKGTPPKPADTGSAGVKAVESPVQQPQQQQQQQQQPVQPQPQQPQGQRKGGLTKPERSRNSNNAEAAFRAPQYGVQTAQMDKEIRGQPSPTQQRAPAQQQSNYHQPQPQSPPQQQVQQQQSQPQQYQQVQPRTSSMPSLTHRARSPPSPGQGQPTPQYPPGAGPPLRPSPPQSYQQSQQRQLPPGAGPATTSRGQGPPPGSPGMRPQGYPQQQQQQQQPQHQHQRQPDPRPMYPQHSGSQGHSQKMSVNGAQPGQIFQYPGGGQYGQQQRGPQPGQIYSGSGSQQVGQIFHHQQYQQQRSPQHGSPQAWEPPQRLPPGQQQQQQQRQPGPALAQPPRRGTSSQGHQDPYGRSGYSQDRRDGQTSPTSQGFYGRPQQPYGGYGQVRPQAVSQYPHHR